LISKPRFRQKNVRLILERAVSKTAKSFKKFFAVLVLINLVTTLIYIPAAIPVKAEELTYNKYFPNAATVVSDANAAINLNWNNPPEALSSKLTDKAKLSDFTKDNSAYLSFDENNSNQNPSSTTSDIPNSTTTQAITTEPGATLDDTILPGDNTSQSTSTDNSLADSSQIIVSQAVDVEMTDQSLGQAVSSASDLPDTDSGNISASTTLDQNLNSDAISSPIENQNVEPDQIASSTAGTSSPDSNIDNTDSNTPSESSSATATASSAVPSENFVTSPHLEYSGFVLASSNPDIASSSVPQTLNLRLSLGGIANPGSALILEYATASSSWQSIGSISFDAEQSNAINGGYYSFQLPVGLFQSVSDLRIRLSYQTVTGAAPASSDLVYLDGLWLEAGYDKTQIDDDEYWANFTLASSTPESFIHLDYINNLLQTNLPGDLSSPITVGSKQSFAGQPFEMLLVGVNASSTGQRVGDKVIYQDAFSSTDLEYHLNDKGLKENIILKDGNHPAKFRYVLNLDNYAYVQNSPSFITLYKKGKQGNPLYKLYSISAPVMTDSNGNTSDKLVFKLKKNLLTLTPDATWLGTASYPVTIDPTVEINILNVVSYPVAGGYWTIDFATVGQEDFSVTPADQASIDDMQFSSLTCDGNAMPATVGDWNVVSSAGWTCGGIGEIKFLDLKTGHHQMIFNFGGVIEDAYNGANVWTGGVDNNWETNGNWSAGLAPVAGDDVVINTAVTVNINAATTVNSLTLGNSGGGVASVLNFNYDAIAGSPLTTAGDLTVYSGASITHTAGTSAIVGRINLSVGGNATITGSINADGDGYTGGNGPGAPANDSNYAAGASYGGIGGNGQTVVAASTYGSSTAPTDLGSGGGNQQAATGGNGGGAIKLNVIGTTNIAGTISANGNNASNCWYSGGGSGGSVYLTTATLTGSGSISVHGGNPCWYDTGSGSGGRIAVYYTTDSSSVTYSSYGSYSTSGRPSNIGGSGTIFKKSVAQSYGDFILDNNNYGGTDETTFGRTPLLASSTFDSITIKNSASLYLATTSPVNVTATTVTLSNNGHYNSLAGTSLSYTTLSWSGIITDSGGSLAVLSQNQDLTIPAGSKLTFNVASSTRTYNNLTVNGTLTHTANTNATTGTASLYKLNWQINGNLTVNSGGSINVDGSGYTGGNGQGSPANDSTYGAGASYGGLGGKGNTVAPTSTYGSLAAPTDLGSGGGNQSSAPGGNGGGAIQLTVTGTTTIASGGAISANGNNASYCWYPGGGSGGSVYLTTATLTGSGSISVHGGNGCSGYGNSGAGGRAAIYYTADSSSITYSSYGGSLGNIGGSGTIFKKSAAETYGDFILDNNNYGGTDETTFGRTPLLASSTFDSITIKNSASLYLATTSPVSATATNLTLSNNGHYNALANTRLIYSSISWGGGRITDSDGYLPVLSQNQDLTIPASATLIFNVATSSTAATRTYNNLTVNGTLTHSYNTNATTGTASLYKLNWQVNGNLTVGAGGSINVDGRGYFSGQGPGQGISYTSGGGTAGGASYGGLGGTSADGEGSGPTYGSLTSPTDLGSGGGAITACGVNGTGGNGGGAVELTVTGTTVVTGTISANGGNGNSNCWAPGGGSGGSVYITSAALSGSGNISVNGGNGVNNNGGGGSGGGGRVAVYYTTDLSSVTYSTYGGNTNNSKFGGSGTTYKKSAAQTYGDLILNNNNLGSTDERYFGLTPLLINSTFDSITAKNSASLYLATASPVSVTTANLTLSNNGHYNALAGTSLSYTTLNWGGIITDSGGSLAVLNQNQDLTIPSGATLVFNTATSSAASTRTYNNLTVNGTLTHSYNTNATTGTASLYKLNWQVNGNLTVGSGGSINVDGRGYFSGQGPGQGVSYTSGGGTAGGASYGGLGGTSHDGVGSGPTYGSLTAPTDLGSGGGAITACGSTGNGGLGGGAIELAVTGTTTVTGTISAKGGVAGDCWSPGGGSGGSVYITTTALSGAGVISVNGGNSTTNNGGGGAGGGGRIAVIAGTYNSTISTLVSGGSIGYQAGSPGTVYPPDYPSLTTQAVTNNVTGTTVTGNGTITSLAFYSITQYGHVWGAAANPYLPNTNIAVAATGGTAYASKQNWGAAVNAFDNDDSTAWGSYEGLPYDLEYDFPAPTVVNKYSITNNLNNYSNYPIDWQFQGWDGGSWISLQTVSSQTGWGSNEVRTFTLSNTNPYSKYRLYITSANGSAVQIARLQLMDTTTFSDTNGATTTSGPYTSNVTGLTPNNSYHIRSYATTYSGTVYGDDQSFSTGAADNPPNAPSSLGPNNFVTDSWTTSTAPSLTFNLSDPDLSDQVQYRFQMDTNSNFSNPIIDYTSALQAQGAASFTVGQAAGGGTYLIGNFGQTLPDNSSYYWRVQAIDQKGATSAFSTANSGIIAFKVDATAPNPGSITFNPYSTSIGVYTTGSSDNLSGVHTFTYANLTTSESNGPTASTLWSNSGLTPNTRYIYAITVTDYAGNSSTTPTSSKYTLAAVPASLQATSTSTSTVALAWNANGNPAGTQYFAENLTGAFNSGWIISTSTTLTGLSCNTSYSFDVVAKNAEGIVTASSTPVSPPASPCNSNPNAPASLGGGYYTGGYWVNNNAPAVSFNLTDPDVSDTVKYEIQFSTTSNFSNLLIDYTSALQPQGGASFTVGQATSTGSYAAGFAGQTLSDNSSGFYWRVKAFDNNNAPSAYTAANSGSVAFKLDTVPPSAGVLSLVDATGTTVTLAYSGSTDSASGLLNPYDFYNTDNWDSSGNTSATEWTDTLSVSGTYHYKVRITDVAGNYIDVVLPGSVDVTVPSSPPPPSDPWNNPPPSGPNSFMLLINQGDTITSARNVTLQLTGPDGAGIANMIVSNHSDLSGGTLESYQTTKSWDLCAGLGGCSNGIYTVYGQFYSSTGSSSPIVSDQIRLQVISTLIPGNLTLGSITNNSISATISGAADNSVGLAASPYIFYNSTANTNSSATSSTAWRSSALSPNTQYAFYASVTNQSSSVVVTPAVSAYTLANVPTGLAISTVSASTVAASWSANGNPDGTEYKVANITAGTNSGWTTATSTAFGNLTCETSYTFVVLARNGNGVETASSSQASGLTGSCTHTITASAGANGSVTPSGAVAVSNGSDQAFTVTPGSGYKVSDVLVDGSSVGGVTSYTFSDVVTDHTIAATFAASSGGGGGGGGGIIVNPPAVPIGNFSIIINNNNVTATNPQVSLALNGGSDANAMAISNFADFSGAIMEPYATTKTWNLCPPGGSCNFGTYTVYAKFYFASGSASQTVSDSIVLTAPVVPPPTPSPKLPVVVLQGSTDQKNTANWATSLQNVEIGQKVSLRALILSSTSILDRAATYQFDCSADGQGGGLTAQSDLTFYTAPNLCSYPKGGTYTARVLVTIDNYTVTATMKIVVSAQTPLPQTHMACQNETCVTVPGQGADLCKTDADCLPATHLACRQFACTAVNGAGENECFRDADCEGIFIGNPPKTPIVIPPANPPAPIGGNPPLLTNPIIGFVVGTATGVAASVVDLSGVTMDELKALYGDAGPAIGRAAKTTVAIARKAVAALATNKASAQVSAGIGVVAVAPTAVAAQYSLVSQGLAINISSFYEFWLYLLSLLYALLTVLGIRAKRRHWGTVYDSENKQPLDPAIVELVDFETGKVAEQSITDLNGRFGFLDKPGKYLIHSKKTHYQFPSRKIFGIKDGAFENLYHGELFEIAQGGNVISPNIPMDPLEFDWNQQDKLRLVKFHPKLEKALNIILSVLFWGGATGVLLLFCVNTNLVNGLFSLLYVFFAILRHLLLRVRLWGRLESNRINTAGLYLELSPASLPKIILGKSMTNQSGKFFLKAKPGQYILRVKEIGSPMGDTLSTKLLLEREIRVGKDGVVNENIKI
jgi:hypothetical protein